MELHAMAYCASDFARGIDTERTVYAAPVFFDGGTEQLPLETLYNHPDFIDLICAQEFELERIVPDRLLQCIVVSSTTEGLDDMEAAITGHALKKAPAADCAPQGDTLRLRFGGQSWEFSSGSTTPPMVLAAQGLDAPACLAAVSCWCVGHPVRFFWPKTSQ